MVVGSAIAAVVDEVFGWRGGEVRQGTTRRCSGRDDDWSLAIKVAGPMCQSVCRRLSLALAS